MFCKISLWTNKYGHCKIRQKHLIITIWSFYGGKVKQLKRDNKCVYRYCNIVLLQSANLSENCSHCTPLWFCIYLIIVYQHLLSIPVNIKKAFREFIFWQCVPMVSSTTHSEADPSALPRVSVISRFSPSTCNFSHNDIRNTDNRCTAILRQSTCTELIQEPETMELNFFGEPGAKIAFVLHLMYGIFYLLLWMSCYFETFKLQFYSVVEPIQSWLAPGPVPATGSSSGKLNFCNTSLSK